MLAVQTGEIELMGSWADEDSTQGGLFNVPISAQTGAASSAAIYFEVEPGKHCGRHVHAAEEIVLILDGEAEAELGDERRPLRRGGVALVPAYAPHDIHNIRERNVRVVGFFPAAAVVTSFEHPLQPLGAREFVLGAPPPEAAAAGPAGSATP